MSKKRREILLASMPIIFLYFAVQLGSCNSLPISNPGDSTNTPKHSATRQPTHTATPTATSPPTYTPRPTFTPQPTYIPQTIFYVDGNLGSDSNPGSVKQPWKTIQKALKNVKAGEMVFIRAGEYITSAGGGFLQHSGTEEKPIIIRNYPGEQVIIKISRFARKYTAFGCWYSPLSSNALTSPKADYIRIIGSDVPPTVLSNGVTSQKGIVIQRLTGVDSAAAGIEVIGCDHWEVAGIDFINLSVGIYTKKHNYGTTFDYSADHWYVHDNRVYSFISHIGMQFNGNYNLIENNQFYKMNDFVHEEWGCAHLNILGHSNVIRGNEIDAKGSTAGCLGVLLEWDLSDANLIEKNKISAVGWGKYGIVSIAGGDNNIIRDNEIIGTVPEWLYFWKGTNAPNWPCNELTNAKSIVPANDPTAPDYDYFYEPRNCFSEGNEVYDNVYFRQ